MIIDILIYSLIFIFFIFVSAFFSSAETAVTAINRVKLKSLIENSGKKAIALAKILEKPRNLITAILIGNNVANVAASAMATAVSLKVLKKVGVEGQAVSLALVTGLMTFIILVFGEITPKTMAIRHPTRWALRITPILFTLMMVFKPAIILFNIISKGISAVFQVPEENFQRLFTEEDLRSAIKIGEEDGVIEEEEKEMIEGVIDFSEKIVREVMTPRTDAICLESKREARELIELISEKGHSRIPIYEDKMDNIIGIVYAKDLLNLKIDQNSLKPFIRPAVFIPETKNIEELLQQMKKAKFHMAIVVDEYGGMAGLVTFEDIIEEIVGEIQDEYDHEQSELTKINENTFVVSATMNIENFAEEIRVTLPDEVDYDTVGGFVLSLLGKFPKKGEVVAYKELQIKIIEISERRILKLEITKSQTESHS
ncbi:MAG: hemolysin family protein [bacterium]